ncbi:putative isomerase YbhE [Auricularia subglabra TFB-10046 SS5]|uniref:Putative isomerase YbhE n=1 Tax=Auricularia subglabra (strain TFB-10046 / SS5) TaxID=717982 RepID=J0WT11_AURST|nr:putative isomerase YbhE [Auricularia subglabra TFB-10046 SS5]
MTNNTYRIALGGPGKTVHIASFDPAASSLALSSSVEASRATWLIAHPSAKGIYFATGEQDGGAVRILRLDSDNAQVVASVRSGGLNPTHLALSPDGAELLVAHYVSGGVGVLRVLPAPPYLERTAGAQTVDFLWTPPAPHEPGKIVPDRQERSHPHQVLVVGHEALVPDLGADKIWRLAKSAGSGAWEVAGALDFPRGSGPRHALFHGAPALRPRGATPDGVLYTVAELSNQLFAHAWPAGEHLGTLPTLPNASSTTANATSPPLLPGEILYADPSTAPPADAPRAQLKADPQLAAEILLDAEGCVYVTNRNEPGEQGDSIVVYSPHPEFKVLQRYYPGVKHLRGIAFSPDGKYVAFAGMNGGGVKVWERAGKGELRDTGARADVEGITSVLWL